MPRSKFSSVLELERLFSSPAWTKYRSGAALTDIVDSERPHFPDAQIDMLTDLGIQAIYVPAELGGALRHFDHAHDIVRALAAEDMTIAIAHAKTFLGSVSVWIGGREEQRRQLADRILAGAVVSLALTERGHGSDLSATSTLALKQGDGGFRLSGEKWLINNARRSDILIVLARTGDVRSARDLSLILVDKAALPASGWAATAKNVTHGVSRADISGIRFDAVPLDATALVGTVGLGLEHVLKGFQLTRTLCASLSCGVADTALRMVLSFAARRRLAGRALGEAPLVRHILDAACIDMLIVDVLSLVSARAINVIPEQMVVVSAIAKAEVPVRAEAMVDAIAEVLGARAMLEEYEDYGGFAALQRNIRLVPIFDGNTDVNLHALRLQLRGLALRRSRIAAVDDATSALLFDMTRPLPDMAWDGLRLAPGGADLVQAALTRLGDDMASRELPEGIVNPLRETVSWLMAERDAIDAIVLSADLDPRRPAAEDYDLASRHCRWFAAACCALVHVHSHELLQDDLRDGAWVVAAAARLRGVDTGHDAGLYALFQRLAAERAPFTALRRTHAPPREMAA